MNLSLRERSWRMVVVIGVLAAGIHSLGAQDVFASGRSKTSSYCGDLDVPQGHYLVATSSEYPNLVSTGASTCVLLTLFDPSTQVGVMAHVSASVDVERSLAEIFALLSARGVKKERLQARLIGGMRGFSELMVDDLRRSLRKRRVRVVEEDVLFDPAAVPEVLKGIPTGDYGDCSQGPVWNPIKSVHLDLQTGAVSDLSLDQRSQIKTCSPVAASGGVKSVTFRPLLSQ